MSIVKQEEVLVHLLDEHIPSKHRTFLVLHQQVQWRFERRRIILAWKCIPKNIASFIMTFLGNESEMQCTLIEKKEAKERPMWLRRFKKHVETWTLCKRNIHYLLTSPLVRNLREAEASIKQDEDAMCDESRGKRNSFDLISFASLYRFSLEINCLISVKSTLNETKQNKTKQN